MNAPQELDFNWRDNATGLVHDARAEGMRLAPNGNLAALRIFTRCGMRVAAVDGKDANTGDVTCVLCLEGDWIPGLFDELNAPAREPVLARADLLEPGITFEESVRRILARLGIGAL